MSWMKRAPSGTGAGASSGPGSQPYASPQAQPFANQQNMYPNYPPGAGNNQQQAPQQPYWQQQPQQPPPQYNEQYTPALYQPDPPTNANQFYQQPVHFNQNYSNQGYNNPSQNYQQNYYQNQPTQSYQHVSGPNDGWEDNWDWGWEDSAKQALNSQNGVVHQGNLPEQVCNNANVIEESFATTQSWNWAMDDKNAPKQPSAASSNQEIREPPIQPTNPIENNLPSEPNAQNSIFSASTPSDVRTLSDRDILKEKMPNLALGKRFHLDNLTPQWSIESQMSQESSDGPHTHSESTYRSENHSRNSNSPGPNSDSNLKYIQSGFDEHSTQNTKWSRQLDETTLADSGQAGSRRESHNELLHTMQDLTLSNHENLSSDNMNQILDPVVSEQIVSRPPAALSPAGLASAPAAAAVPLVQPPVRPPSVGLPPAPSPSAQSVPPSVAGTPQLPPLSTSSLPPPNFPQPSNSQNPFKHAGPFAHKPKASSSSAPVRPFSPQISNAGLTSPTVVNKAAQQSRTPVGFEANLETTPDNSERPDHPLTSCFRPTTTSQQVPDNMEVAPQNDRNEYLQTAHLSSGDYGENTDFTRNAPPPGLRRMVVGRHEAEYGASSHAAADEPPPGLARMVPGQHTGADDYLERLIDGRPTDCGRPYRQAEGQRSPETYAPRAPERRPVGRDEYAPYAGAGAARIVTGLEREQTADGVDYSARDGTMEGENLQDLSLASSAEPPPAPPPPDRTDGSDSLERPAAPERRASLARKRSSDDGSRSERDRAFDAEPRRDRHKTSRDRDRDKEGRYSRGDRKYERDDDRKPAREERRSDKDRRLRDRDRDRDRDRERREREDSPDRRRQRRSTRSRRYDTEDTDCYSDKERDRRRRREPAAAKPPRAERRAPERRYRAIDPARTAGNLRRERDESRRHGEPYSSPSRPDSREAPATDEDEGRRRERRHRTRRSDPYYEGYEVPAYGEQLSRQQYEYYSRLRLADPAAYMQLYRRLMAAAHAPHHALDGYGGAYEPRGDERGSVHSGRSSAHLKGNDTDLNTDASLNLQLEESTVRSERMTPHRFSTAHIKGSISSRDVVIVQPSYPVDGRPATVRLLALAALAEPSDLTRAPGPLVKGVTHKKSVIEYCAARVRRAAREGARDVLGYTLLWQLLALALTQNGVVVGSDIAELLMKSTKEHEYKTSDHSTHSEERRASSVSGSPEETRVDPDDAYDDEGGSSSEAAALDTLREHLVSGNRQEAIEWAVSRGLWGHAMSLAAHGGRRARASVAARFLNAVPRADPLHTLYATLARGAHCVDERVGDWRPHAAIVLANMAPNSDHDQATLTQLGDSLASRGLLYSAQFMYVSCGVPFSRHPLAPLASSPVPPAPPRLSLLLADSRAASLAQFATDRAIVATEIYEYALSLNRDYVIKDFQVYKFVAACRLCDAGQYERSLVYVEMASRAIAAAPRDYCPQLVRGLAELADRLKYHDPALQQGVTPEEGGDSEDSPRHQQWLDDVKAAADMLQAESAQHTPLHHMQQAQYSWDQTQQYQQQQYEPQQTLQPPPPSQPELEDSPEYPHYYQPPPAAPADPAPNPNAPAAPGEGEQYLGGYDWQRTEEHHAQTYAEPNYWQQDSYSYGETAGEEVRPTITMPGAPTAGAAPAYPDYDAPATDQQLEHHNSSSSTKAGDASKDEAREGRSGGKAGGGSWLGGLFTKLSLRPPNQMILPDDKNPSIVWDADAKRWKNLEGDEPAPAPAPPPPALPPQPQPSSSPPLAGAPPSNMLRMQKGRHIKNSYVDVFNPGGARSAPAPAPAPSLAPAPAMMPTPAYFVPAPAQDYDSAGLDQYRSGI